MRLLPTINKFFYKLGRTLNKQFPNQLPFQKKSKFYKEFKNLKMCLRPSMQRELLEVLQEKNSFGGQFNLGSRVLNRPPMNVSKLNGMHALKGKVKVFFTTNRNMPYSCSRCFHLVQKPYPMLLICCFQSKILPKS